MSKITSQVHKSSKNQTEMAQSWSNFKWLLKQDVERLDYRMFKMYQESCTLGVTKEYYNAFVQEHMTELIQTVVKEREEREGHTAKSGLRNQGRSPKSGGKKDE